MVKGVNYKSGAVPTMMVDISAKEANWKPESQTRARAAPASESVSSVAVAAGQDVPPPSASTSGTAASAVVQVAAAPGLGLDGKKTDKSATDTSPPPASSGFFKKGFLGGSSKSMSTPKEKETQALPPPSTGKQLVQEVTHQSVAPAVSESTKNTLSAPQAGQQEGGVPSPLPAQHARYSMVERGVVGMGDFAGLGGKQSVSSSRYWYCTVLVLLLCCRSSVTLPTPVLCLACVCCVCLLSQAI